MIHKRSGLSTAVRYAIRSASQADNLPYTILGVLAFLSLLSRLILILR